jgi:flagellar protein FliT
MTPQPRAAIGGRREGLLAHYEAIEQASADMLLAACSGDWALVVQLEGACSVLIDQLKKAAQAQPLAPELRKARLQILQRILSNDAQIRHLAEPWTLGMATLLAMPPRTTH